MKINELSDDNDWQQKLLSANPTSKGPHNHIFLRLELNRLTSENLDMHEQNKRLSEENRRLRKMLKERRVSENINKMVTGVVGETTTNANDLKSIVLVVHKMDSKKEYLGMFEFKRGDEPIIIRRLVTNLKPNVALTLLPGLPAYILFMCIRHNDFINDDEEVKLLLNYYEAVKSVIKRQNDFETMVLWLSNSERLLHVMKQYSGDAATSGENSLTQSEQYSRNFNLSEFRRLIFELAVWIYQRIIVLVEERIQQKAISGIVEHEAKEAIRIIALIAGFSHDTSQRSMTSLDMLLHELTTIHKTLVLHDVDADIRTQVFRQLFYFISANCFNNLLLRKDLCYWSKGMQIRFNISHLEEWARDQKLQHSSLHEMLTPLIQASQLLQARKTDDDVKSVCDMCNEMSANQIIKLLSLLKATPADDNEESVPSQSFIRKVQQCLEERGEPRDLHLLMNTNKKTHPVNFPFNPSNIRLEDIEIPEVLNLPMLKKVYMEDRR